MDLNPVSLTFVGWMQVLGSELDRPSRRRVTTQYDPPSLRLDLASDTWVKMVWPSPTHNLGRVDGISVVV